MLENMDALADRIVLRLVSQGISLVELRQFLGRKRIGVDSSGRRYIVTDGVLYEDEFPTAFAALIKEKSDAEQDSD